MQKNLRARSSARVNQINFEATESQVAMHRVKAGKG